MRAVNVLLALLVAALIGLPHSCRGDIIQGEATPTSELASHDGMIFFGSALRMTIPPNATAPAAASDLPAAAVPCACSDAAPRDTSGGTPPFLVTTDCFSLAQFGNCNASFMQSYLQELVFSDGFCQISCGRCPCCSAPTVVLEQLGATRFLQALAVAQPSLLDALSHPGYMGTILVPTDAAFDAALAQYSTLLRDPAALQQVLKFHLLPPEPRTRGLWTTPFMAVGAKLWTSYDGSMPLQTARQPLPAGTTQYGGLTGLRIQGPANAATVIGPSDVMACKAYLTVVDTVLLPANASALAMAQAAPPDNSAGGSSGMLDALLGIGTAGQCVVQANAGLNATTLVPGASNRQHSVGDCCASCAQASATPGCNAFQFCSQKGGCRLADANGTALKFGHCELMHDADIAAGQPPAWAGWSGTNPLVSGYINSQPVAAPATPAAG